MNLGNSSQRKNTSASFNEYEYIERFTKYVFRLTSMNEVPGWLRNDDKRNSRREQYFLLNGYFKYFPE